MAAIKQKFEGDSGKLRQEYQKLQRENVKLMEQMRQLAKQSQKSQRSSTKAIRTQGNVASSGISRLKGMAAGWITVGGAIAVANKILAEHNRLSDMSAKKQITVADSQAKVIKSIGNATNAETNKFLKDVEKVRKEVGAKSIIPLNLAAAAGLSASSGDRDATLSSLRASGRLTRDAPEDLEVFTGAAIDVQKASGIKDARKNLGFLLSVGGQSRIVKTFLQAKNIAPAVSSIVNTTTGDRENATREAGALFATATNLASDAEGAPSGTATTKFAINLREFFQGKGAFKKSKGKEAEDPGTLFGRIEAIAKSDSLKSSFLESASFETRFKIPFEQILTNPEVLQQLKDTKKEISFDENLFEKKATQLSGLTPQLRLATGSAKSKGNIEKNLTNSTLGVGSTAREIVKDTLEQTRGRNSLAFIVEKGFLTGFDIAMNKGFEGSVVGEKILLSRREQLVGSKSGLRKTIDTDVGARALTDAELSKVPELEREQILLLREQIQVLRQIREGNQNGSANLEVQNHTERP